MTAASGAAFLIASVAIALSTSGLIVFAAWDQRHVPAVAPRRAAL